MIGSTWGRRSAVCGRAPEPAVLIGSQVIFNVAGSRRHSENSCLKLPFLASLWPLNFFFLQMEKNKQESKGDTELSDCPQAHVKHFQVGEAIVGNHAQSLV